MSPEYQIQGNERNVESILGKLGVPKPVSGSHPRDALKPSVPHPGFVPFVMSLNMPGLLYNYRSSVV